MATLVTALSSIHDLKSFDCGNNELNTYLQSIAGQHQRKYISKTYVLVDEDNPTLVLGFYTLANRKMVLAKTLPAALKKRLPTEIPAFTLARLAIDVRHQKKEHGEYLLLHAMNRAARVADEIGGFALFVDAKDVAAAGFYRKYGYLPLPDNPLILCMPFSDMPK